MIDREEFQKIVFKNKEAGLSISRLPKKTKEEFIKFAREEFADDYGMCFHAIFEKFKETINIQETFDIKLNYIISMLESSGKSEHEEKPEEVKLFSGRKVMKGG